MTTQGLTLGWFIAISKSEGKENRDFEDLSGTTHPLTPNPASSLPNESSSDRLLIKAKKHTSRILNSPGRKLEKMAAKRRLRVEKSTPGNEFIVQSGEVTVRNGYVSCVISQPIPKGKKLRKVIITAVSKDQGWSDYLEDYGTHRSSRTWFELSVASPSEGPGEKWRGLVVKNLLAYGDFKEQTKEMEDKELYEKADSGDVLTVWAHAGSQDSVNTVKKVVIKYTIE